MAVQDNLQGTIRTIHHKVREYIGEELWGDLWEEHHRLLKKKTPITITQLLTIYRYIQMVWAKCQISFQNRKESYYCEKDKSKKNNSSEYSKYKIRHHSNIRKITSVIFGIIRRLRLPVVTILLIFLFVIFSNSIDANSLSKTHPITALDSQVQAATKPQIVTKEAESKQKAAESKQKEAESKQKAAEFKQKEAESKQKAAESKQQITKADYWLQVAKQEKEQAQHWLQVAKQEKEQAQHWLQVAKQGKEQAQSSLQLTHNENK
ncbi:hypothetical protein H6G27_11165 [Nostoc linckia FACHB-104]|nr:hypothetical protein [Nostoc linckia FACHB-104]